MTVPAAALDGWVLPRGVPQEAAHAVLGLRRMAAACRAAVDTLNGPGGALPAQEWDGEAAQAYRDRCVVLSRRCSELDELTSTAAGLLHSWSVSAAADRERMVRARVAFESAGYPDPSTPYPGQLFLAPPDPAQLAAVRAWDDARECYWSGLVRLGGQLDGLRDLVSDRSLSVAEQGRGFIHQVWQEALAGPVEQVWSVTGQAVTDPGGWWRTVSAIPGLAREAVARVFTDPLGVLGDAVDLPAWQRGHLGEGLGAVAALFVPGPKWLKLGEPERLRFIGHGPAVARAVRRLQTVAELLDGVDLAAHENEWLGHTLSRHVEVSDEYLMDRLTHGTLLEDGRRAERAPDVASRFTDQATAEAAITEALRANETAVRRFAAHPTPDGLAVQLNCGRDIGVVYRAAHGGGFLRVQGQTVFALVKARPGGGVYLETAFVKGGV